MKYIDPQDGAGEFVFFASSMIVDGGITTDPMVGENGLDVADLLAYVKVPGGTSFSALAGTFTAVTRSAADRGQGFYKFVPDADSDLGIANADDVDYEDVGMVVFVLDVGGDHTTYRQLAFVPYTIGLSVNVRRWQDDQPDNLDASGNVPADVYAWLGSTVNALVSGRVDSSVGAMAADVMTAAAAASDLTTELQAGLATAANLALVQSDTDDIQTRLPAALVGGRMDSSVGAMAADVLTAAATATDFGTEIAAAVWDAIVEGSHTFKGYMRGLASALIFKENRSGTSRTFRDAADTKDRITATATAAARTTTAVDFS